MKLLGSRENTVFLAKMSLTPHFLFYHYHYLAAPDHRLLHAVEELEEEFLAPQNEAGSMSLADEDATMAQTERTIARLRKRDAEQVGADEDYKRMAYEQFTRLGKKAYPVLCSSPEKAIATADGYIAAGHVPDIVFFDLPGTVNSEGVINSLAGMDYIFTPISAAKGCGGQSPT